ncbi:hypothetical protein [Polynucleobacter sphagniphilus]|uniref:hypothetical protein n=1 Tax=Polynucleobacter sphagniphilus TaxID=1743169 RepID=UPI00247638DC|nr:hypothetical protein [Polynucleobacter sphagniphilus]MDH6525582.1 hypothetical protein [Polynucleobacter sphagniphilus]
MISFPMLDQLPVGRRRCLLIAPLSFYTFHKSLSYGLEKKGFVVDVINDEFPDNVLGKILGKIFIPLLRKLTLWGLHARLGGQPPYDLVLIIKGRGLGVESLAYLRTKALNLIGYNFDSFLFNPSPLDWQHLTDRYATFDIQDAKKYGLPLVHLFSDIKSTPAVVRDFDISIIQRIHSNRLVLVGQLLRALPTSVRAFIFLYEKNIFTFALGVLRFPIHYARLWPYISFRPLSHTQAMQALGRSRVTFDFAHPLQSGITIRCFEAQSLGVAIYTNNPEVIESGLFSHSGVACFSGCSDSKALVAMCLDLMKHIPAQRCRSIEEFLDELLFIGAPIAPSTFNIGRVLS